MRFHILTLFPEMVQQGLAESIIGRAAANDILSIDAVNIRDYTIDKHRKTDDYPYGGGAGMLMQAQPVYDAWKSVAGGGRPRTVYLTPQGQTFTQKLARELAREDELVLLCGHYEGIDERVLEEIVTDYISIGDYVLTGGELPAMVLVDAVSRMVPGVLGNGVSGETESFEGDLLEYPQYSRPEEWHGKRVPPVLLSGNQKEIAAWRREAAVARTRERRPDLYRRYEALRACLPALKKEKLLHIDMTELIERGQACLVYVKGRTVCLCDTASGIYLHTAENREDGIAALFALREDAAACGEESPMLTLHQEFMREDAQKLLGVEETMSFYQAVYTRKEKLPVSGLYQTDAGRQEKRARRDAAPNGKEKKPAAEIRRLTLDELAFVRSVYRTVDDEDYIRDRIEKGWMYGAFVDGVLAGFAGMHTEGGLGLLEVLPEYRKRHIGKALETYLINLSLEQGMTPYGQVAEDNEASRKLQESLGLCFSRQKVYWMEKKHPEKL